MVLHTQSDTTRFSLHVSYDAACGGRVFDATRLPWVDGGIGAAGLPRLRCATGLTAPVAGGRGRPLFGVTCLGPAVAWRHVAGADSRPLRLREACRTLRRQLLAIY